MTGLIAKYIVRKYLRNFIIILLSLASIILLIDFLENSRKFADEGLHFLEILFFSLLKLPEIIAKIFFFIIFLSGLLTFNAMQNSSELVIIRNSGQNLFYHLKAVIFVVFMLGILQMALLNPVAKTLNNIYVDKSKIIQEGQISSLDFTKQTKLGLWFIQKKNGEDEFMINIKAYEPIKQSFKDLYFLCIKCTNHPEGSLLFAKSARLQNNSWFLEEVTINDLSGNATSYAYYQLGTNIDHTALINQFHSDSLLERQIFDIWKLPGLIKTVQASGLSINYLLAYLFDILLTPVFFILLLLISLLENLVLHRNMKNTKIFAKAMALIFVIYFLKNLAFGMVIAGNLTIFLGVVNPILIIMLMILLKYIRIRV